MAYLNKTGSGGYIFDAFTDGNYTANPVWTVDAGTWSASSYYLRSTSGSQARIHVALTKTCSNAFLVKGKIYFEKNAISGNYAMIEVTKDDSTGYGIFINKVTGTAVDNLRIIKSTGDWAWTDLDTMESVGAELATWNTFIFSRNSSGVMHFWLITSANVYHLTATDATYSDFTRFRVLDRFYASDHYKRFDDLEVLEYPQAETIKVTGLIEDYRVKLFDGSDVLKGDAFTNVYPFTQFGRTDHTAVHNLNAPHAYYHNGVTYFVWMDEECAPWIIKYTHSTDTWSEPVRIDDPVPDADNHSSPVVIVDTSGYILVFSVEHGGATNGDLWCWHSTNTEDITSWGTKVSAANYGTYPHLARATISSTDYIYCFFRGKDNNSPDCHYYGSWIRSSDHGATWSAPSTFIDFSSGTDWVYPLGFMVDSNNYLHVVFMQCDGVAPTDCHDNMYAKSLDGGSTWKEADGTGYSLPITYAAAEKIVTATNPSSGVPDLDSSDTPYVCVNSYVYYWNGSSWANAQVVAGMGQGATVQAISSTDIRVYGVVSSYLEYYQSTNGGSSWSHARTLADVDSNARITPIQGHNGCVWNDSYRGVYAYMPDEWETEARLLQEVSELAFPFTGYFKIYNENGEEVSRAPASGNWDNIWTGDIYAVSVIIPSPASAIAQVVAPTVKNDLSITPSPASAISQVVQPTVKTGNVIILPTAVDAIAGVVNPTVVHGSLTLAPDFAASIADRVNPTVILGSTTATPEYIKSICTVIPPTVIAVGLNITPDPASALGAVVAPTVVYGSLVITPDEIYAVAQVVAPTVKHGNLILSPEYVKAIARVINPTIGGGGIIIEPEYVRAIARGENPEVILGSTTVTPEFVRALAGVIAPSIFEGNIGRKLRVVVLTSQYRKLNLVTSQKRRIKTVLSGG